MALVDDAPTAAPGPAGPAADDGRLWRSTWRVHFYAGIFALPVLVLFALTGLGILYTDVINDLQYGDLQTVAVGSGTASLDDQRAAVEESYPD